MTRKGPKICAEKLPYKSPLSMRVTEVVSPQIGHGIPVIARNGHVINLSSFPHGSMSLIGPSWWSERRNRELRRKASDVSANAIKFFFLADIASGAKFLPVLCGTSDTLGLLFVFEAVKVTVVIGVVKAIIYI